LQTAPIQYKRTVSPALICSELYRSLIFESDVLEDFVLADVSNPKATQVQKFVEIIATI
jgi:hypothetical protein